RGHRLARGLANPTRRISNIYAADTDFSVSGSNSSVAVGATETFIVTLSGTSAGTFNTSITIVSDDFDEALFTFPVTGEITAPEINLYVGTDNTGTALVDQQAFSVDFGSGRTTPSSDNCRWCGVPWSGRGSQPVALENVPIIS
ncbi:MAG: hypothetical protein AAF483_07455, partial [Planctomycetota bacterium]